MAAGQGLLAQGVLPPAVVELEARLSAGCVARHAVHAQLLGDALALLRCYEAAGQVLSVPAELARVWRCSEATAVALLTDAEVLGGLPDALAVLSAGALTVEQSRALRCELEPLPAGLRVQVWEPVRSRLLADAESGVPPTPGRLRELVRRHVRRLDPAGVAARRRQACRDRADVEVWRDADGLVDVRLAGVSPPLAQAALLRIRALSAPIGPADERTAGQRRRDAAIDLLLGRACLPLDTGSPDGTDPGPDRTGRGASGPGGGSGGGLGSPASGPGPDGLRPWCGCGAGHPVPCGAQVTVLVPLATALGTADEPAELLGHGPLDGDLLHALLLSGPDLTVVFVDEHGTPVADSPLAVRPPRGDPAALRDALLRLARAPVGAHQPRHPDDHQPPERPEPEPPDPPDPADPPNQADPPDPRAQPDQSDQPDLPGSADPPDPPARPLPSPPPSPVRVAGRRPGGTHLPGTHPPGTPGPYRVPARLRRFLQVRAPHCEWPGCRARAIGCDQDHDRAWPTGPTCPCNLGPLCRRHHRIKQTGWTKTRHGDGTLTWTGPTGQQTTRPAHHQPPPAPVRPLPALPAPRTGPELLDTLGPIGAEHERAAQDPGGTWLHGSDPTDQHPDDTDPDDTDTHQWQLRHGHTTWTTDLDDHTQWQPAES